MYAFFYLLNLSLLFCLLRASKDKNKTKDLDHSHSEKIFYHYVPSTSLDPSYNTPEINQDQPYPHNIDNVGLNQHHHQYNLESMLQHNPLLAAIFLSSTLGIPPTPPGFNHPQHPPINPYVALLLSHYGKYLSVPYPNSVRRIYGYTAANNYHNNKPFGAYKVYEDV